MGIAIKSSTSVGSMDGKSSSAVDVGVCDDEPVLKYQRMGADVGKLLSTPTDDLASGDDGGNIGVGNSNDSSSRGHSGREEVVRMAVHDSYLVSSR